MKDFFMNNKVFTNKQFMSTSTDDFLKGFGEYKDGYTINLKIKNSKSGVNISPLSAFGADQREILMPSGTRYKILSANVRKNVLGGYRGNATLKEVLDVVLEEI